MSFSFDLVCLFSGKFFVMGHSQQTINPKDRKSLLWDHDLSPSLPSGTYTFTSVALQGTLSSSRCYHPLLVVLSFFHGS